MLVNDITWKLISRSNMWLTAVCLLNSPPPLGRRGWGALDGGPPASSPLWGLFSSWVHSRGLGQLLPLTLRRCDQQLRKQPPAWPRQRSHYPPLPLQRRKIPEPENVWEVEGAGPSVRSGRQWLGPGLFGFQSCRLQACWLIVFPSASTFPPSPPLCYPSPLLPHLPLPVGVEFWAACATI